MAKKAALTKDDIVEALKEMSVLDVAELVKSLEETFGVSATAPVAVAAAGPAATAEAAPEEEKTDFNVLLKEIGPNKINVIKAVREVTTLGLKEAKELVEGAPASVKEGIGKEEADQVKEKLEGAGGVVEVQ
jgi:large subunit ribosomal protein L7/L12